MRGTRFVDSKDVVRFEWPVPAEARGFEVIRARVWRGDHGLTDNRWDVLVLRPGARLKKVNLLTSTSALFREFAALDLDDVDSIVTFADRYGSLTGLNECLADVPGRRRRGERLVVWQRAICALRQRVDLWDWIQKRNLSELNKRFRWHVDTKPHRENSIPFTGWWYNDGPNGTGGIISQVTPYPDIPKNDVLGAARVQLAREINEHLSRGRSVLSSEGAAFELRICPSDLLGALYIQFARTITGEYEQRQCLACQAWLTITQCEDNGKRTGALYCDSTCRKRAHRARSHEARQGARKSVRNIKLKGSAGKES